MDDRKVKLADEIVIREWQPTDVSHYTLSEYLKWYLSVTVDNCFGDGVDVKEGGVAVHVAVVATMSCLLLLVFALTIDSGLRQAVLAGLSGLFLR